MFGQYLARVPAVTLPKYEFTLNVEFFHDTHKIFLSNTVVLTAPGDPFASWYRRGHEAGGTRACEIIWDIFETIFSSGICWLNFFNRPWPPVDFQGLLATDKLAVGRVSLCVYRVVVFYIPMPKSE